MDIPVLVSKSFEKLPEIELAINAVNRQQAYFRLSVMAVDWIPDSDNKKWIDQYRLFAEIGKRLGNEPACVVVQNPLKLDFFSDYKPNIYIFSIADWTAKYAPPPLGIYLIYMLACGLVDLACELPEEVSDSALHDPPIGCISDYCSDKNTIKFSMTKAYICPICKKILIKHGLDKQALKSTEQILAFVNNALVPYDEATPHDAFICYSSSDKKFARKLANDLAARGIKVWFDEFEMLPGDSLYEKIQQGIQKSVWFMIVLSPKSVQSKWCKRELHNAMEEEFERNNVYVIPVFYKQCTIPGFLKEKIWVNLRGKNYEDGVALILKRLRNK